MKAEALDLRERIDSVRVLAGKAATQTDYTSAGEKAIRLLPEMLESLSRADRAQALLRECFEMRDSWPGIAYTDELESSITLFLAEKS